MLFADVIIDISHEAIDRSFQYIAKEPFDSSIKVGSLVLVPFGKGDKLKKGYCIGLSDKPKIDTEKLKSIAGIEESDISIEGQLISLAMWMARTYGSTMAAALRSVLPVAKKAALSDKKSVKLSVSNEKAREFIDEQRDKKRYSLAKVRLLEELLKEEVLPWEVIIQKLNIASATIRSLEKQGLVSVLSQKSHFIPKKIPAMESMDVTLNDEQSRCIETFVSNRKAKRAFTYLLHGITGSGKTEVYIRMIREVLSVGKSAIVLIPEIALTYQTLMRFYHSFGEQVSVMNSRLSAAEKYDIVSRAKAGEIKIIIGPRSALFTPFKDLGLIIIDEEHESSYKSEKSPRYHAREAALFRASLCGADVVLGSATPSVESYYRAMQGEFILLTLTKRAKSAPLADCEIVDLRAELRAGNRSIISRRLYDLMRKNLDGNMQTMLFINRRGMLASVACRACGEVIKCPHCDVSLSLHRDGRLHCHYCGYETVSPKECPVCQSRYIGGFKAGTEKIEALVSDMFPDARVLRMDADSTKGKDGHEKILSRFANKEADILIGTQMIVKGHDFPDVSLVGILAADLSLNDNDFRSSERTFDLITQAAGRAGRADKRGNVIIQTYRPDSYAVSFAAAQDYLSFYKREIEFRSIMNYPPVAHMLLVILQSKNEPDVVQLGDGIAGFIEDKYPDVWVSRAVKPGVSKIKDIHRRIIYIKDVSDKKIEKIRSEIEDFTEDTKTNVSVYFDLDPMGFY